MGRSVDPLFRSQYGVISRQQALTAGMTPRQIQGVVRRGSWERLHLGVYRLSSAAAHPRGQLLAACLARPGAVASHESAAWLWDLTRDPPPVPTLSVARSASHRPSGPIVVHQALDLAEVRVVTWKKIPCTNPLRTLVDLAGSVGPTGLDEPVDRALMCGLVSVNGLLAEIDRARGRPGARLLRVALARRGAVGAPHPSVLESRVLRLLAKGGIRPRGTEVRVKTEDGQYRLDVVLSDRVALEVDGYAHHGSAEAMGRDLHRHNDLGMAGWIVLRFTWVDVVNNGDWVLCRILEALRRFG